MPDINPLFLQQLQQGELHAIKQLYQLAYTNCLEVILLNKGTEKQARSIFQEALLLLIKKIQTPPFNLTVLPEVYLYSICCDLWLTKLQSTTKIAYTQLKFPSNSIALVELQEEKNKPSIPPKQQIINTALDQLGVDAKQVLVAFYFKKMTLKELAEQFNYSVAYAKVHKNRCMDNLKQKITELYQQQG